MGSAIAVLEAPIDDERRSPSEASNVPALAEPNPPERDVDANAARAQSAGVACAVERLATRGPKGRLTAYRSGRLSRRERTIWACRYPEEVPLLNGEVEWIALRMADLD